MNSGESAGLDPEESPGEILKKA